MKKESRKSLKKRLDTIFSEYIRRRDYALGYGCVSCGKKLHWKEGQAGHFIRRGVIETRFEPLNVSLQCGRCNCWLEGEKDLFRKTLVERHGEEAIKSLEAKRFENTKPTITDYENMIEHFKKEIELLKKT